MMMCPTMAQPRRRKKTNCLEVPTCAASQHHEMRQLGCHRHPRLRHHHLRCTARSAIGTLPVTAAQRTASYNGRCAKQRWPLNPATMDLTNDDLIQQQRTPRGLKRTNSNAQSSPSHPQAAPPRPTCSPRASAAWNPNLRRGASQCPLSGITQRHSCISLRAQRVIIALFVVLLAQFIRQRRGFSCVPRTAPQMPQKCPGDAPQGPASAPEMPQTCPANAPEMPRAIPACPADAPEMPRKSPARVGLLPQKRPFLCPTFRNAWLELAAGSRCVSE